MSPEVTVLVSALGPSVLLVSGIIGFLLRRTRKQDKLIARMRIHLITTCMDKAEGMETLAQLLLSDGEEAS